MLIFTLLLFFYDKEGTGQEKCRREQNRTEQKRRRHDNQEEREEQRRGMERGVEDRTGHYNDRHEVAATPVKRWKPTQ